MAAENTPQTQQTGATSHQPTAPAQGGSPSGGATRTMLYMIVFAILALGLGAGAQWLWKRYTTHLDTGRDPFSGDPILVIDSGKVAASLLKAANDDPTLAPLKAQPAALGSLVGRGIRQAAQSYAAKGYLVLDSSAVLGAPESHDITAAVTQAVMRDAQSAAAMMSTPASQPAAAKPEQPSSPPDAQEASTPAKQRLP